MWFQDLFNYDFRRTEMCIIPYATQQGEISFCAYNTGIGWRKIIEKMHKNATVAQWYKTHGKHEIYAKGKKVDLASYEHSLRIDEDDAARVRHLEHDIPLTAAEEDRIRRKKALEEAAQVRRIYEELVLKKPQETVVQIGTIQQIQTAVPGSRREAGSNFACAVGRPLEGQWQRAGPRKGRAGRSGSVGGGRLSSLAETDPSLSSSLGFGPGGCRLGAKPVGARRILGELDAGCSSTSTGSIDRLSIRSSYNVPVARDQELAYANLRICL